MRIVFALRFISSHRSLRGIPAVKLPLRAMATFALAAALAGCAVLSSQTPQELVKAGRMPLGVQYSLPLSIVDLTLSVKPATAEFVLAVSDPRSIVDPNHTYILKYRPLPNYHDEIDITLGPNSFLKTVNSTTEDQTPQVIVNLFKLAGRLANGGLESDAAAPATVSLATVSVNPLHKKQVRKALVKLSNVLKQYASEQTGGCGDLKAHQYTEKIVCNKWELFAEGPTVGKSWTLKNVKNGPVQLRIRGVGEVQPNRREYESKRGARNIRRAPDGNCSVGICYRPLLPYYVYYWIAAPNSNLPPKYGSSSPRASGLSHANVRYMLLPNEAPLVEIDIRRGFFSQKIQKITFTDKGFLHHLHIDKESEIEAISSLPLDIINAMAAVLRFRASISESQTNEANALKGLIEQRRLLRQQQATLESARIRARALRNTVTSSTVLPVPQQTRPLQTAAGPGSISFDPN